MAKRRGNGEGGIYQRESDGKWCASVDLGFVNGKRRRKVMYGKIRKEVADKLKALHRDQASGVHLAVERQTVETFLMRWLDDVVSQRNKARTQDSYRTTVRRHMVPTLGHIQLDQLRPEHVQMIIRALQAQELHRTAQYARTILVRALNQAVKWRLLSFNPAALTEPPHVEKHVIEPLTIQQARALLEAVQGDPLEALYHIALSLGLRRGEILGLRPEDFHLEQGELRITGTIQRIRGKLVRPTPKTKTSIRTLYLPETVYQRLHDHLERQQTVHPNAQYVFVSRRGTAIDPRNLLRRFKRALKQAGLPETIQFHDLRHSCATFLIAQGEHPRVLMAILGHAQISTTMDIYGHVLPETHQAAAAKMDALFSKEESADKEEDAAGE